MRYGVLAAIWNHPDSFRQIFAFGLNAPEHSRKSGRSSPRNSPKPPAPQGAAPDLTTPGLSPPGAEPLLPRMPLPAHLKDRGDQ